MNLKSSIISAILPMLVSMGYSAATVEPYALINIWSEKHIFYKKTIGNTGDQTAYLKVELYTVKNPHGQEVDTLMTKKDQMSSIALKQDYLIIPPHQKADIVLLMPQGYPNFKTDHFYRVSIAPDAALAEKESHNKSVAIGIQIGIGYKIGLIVRPKNSVFDVKTQQSGNSVTLTNNGNTVVRYDLAGTCTTKEIADKKFASLCQATGYFSNAYYLYAGTSKTYDLSNLNEELRVVLHLQKESKKHLAFNKKE